MLLAARHTSSSMRGRLWIMYSSSCLDNGLKMRLSNYLQMGNGASFIGDLIHSKHFSRVVRLCLHLGVEPVFIAPSKPWMNGTIEDNNWGVRREVMGTRTMDRSGTHSERGENVPDAAQHFARTGSTGRPIWRLYRSAGFRRILRSM
uniref:Integrase catalytic domain-containing protein n=1 Tax=Candidatus Methanogaster sp. ANME-2c ERB4 TaxID=2759911 RepID=A0A7G9YNC5_9EURY|nr:hypothetical protein FBKNMHLG_00028 [Methanosarcinales archaeon ANME-2c ERB4]